MLKAVLFDFDGVLTTEFNGTNNIARNLQKKIPLDLETIAACYRQHFRHLLLSSGRHADHLSDFCASLGADVSLDDMQWALRTVPVNEAMMALARFLKNQYKTGIITDNGQERFELLKLDLQLPSLFHPILVSGECGFAKGDGTTRIFDRALQEAGCTADEALFIDNQQRNLVTAAAIGMKTYWHDDAKNDMSALVTALKKLGVSV